MMRLFKMILVLCCLGPALAQAQQAWGDEGGCARVQGKPALTDMVFILWPDRIERHESSCRIVDVQGDLNTRAVIETECTGEGETWTQAYGMTPNGPDMFVIWPTEAPEFTTALLACG